jgi:sterol desaturase/sphingolipid hydroxylase (fatty acid hydroxylase superfamily)
MLSFNLVQWMNAIIGSDQIAPNTVYQLQKQLPNLVPYILPLIFFFTLLEFIAAFFGNHKTYNRKETIGSLCIGIGNFLVNLVLKTTLVSAAVWLYNLVPWRMQMNWYTLPFCFLCYDFCSYWSHRISHYNRFFWATHVVHHSANHYNLTVAFRQSWVQHFKSVFFVPVVLLGFHPLIVLVASQLSTLYQFWVHTEAIGKLHPFIEKYFGTPSNHRVHHGSQEKYLDKNFGATLMIWDHLFGSFQYEEEQPIYGLTKPIESKINPFSLNFHEYRDMLQDLRQSDGIKEMLFFLFASPGKIYRYKLNRQKNGKIRHSKLNKTFVKITLIMMMLFLVAFAQAQDITQLPISQTENLLFFLQRKPDANVVIYKMNYNTDGSINMEVPIKGLLIRDEKGKINELTGIAQKFLYGIKSKALDSESFEIKLVAFQKISPYLLKSEDQKYHVYIKDARKNMLLKRVFVKVNGAHLSSKKHIYIDLFTVNSETGIEMLKRVNLD